MPNLSSIVADVQKYGAQGITVHPRPDERHIKYQDVRELKPIITTEYNIEGNPNKKFMELVLEVRPTQVTLVPDSEDVLTSNAGWDTITHKMFLAEVIAVCKQHGIRTSIFVDPIEKMIEGAKAIGADRIELYTENYASQYALGNTNAVEPYKNCAILANKLGLGVNAGHDLSLQNISFFKANVPHLLEVSIGHALICEAIYEGLESIINQYLEKLK